ncbi:MAG: hypothetical protein ACRDGK_02645 [Actinomycetota bacterium]
MTAATEGFSGAELEGVVVAALYRAFAEGAEITTDDLLIEASATPPLSRSREHEIEAMRAWARGRAVAAGGIAPS